MTEEPLTYDEYQELSKQTAIGFASQEDIDPEEVEDLMFKFKLLFLVTAINGEAGELAEKVKKAVREDDESYLEDALSEMGDIDWYLAQFATLLDTDRSEVAESNLDKLLDRQERDQITGEGDHR